MFNICFYFRWCFSMTQMLGLGRSHQPNFYGSFRLFNCTISKTLHLLNGYCVSIMSIPFCSHSVPIRRMWQTQGRKATIGRLISIPSILWSWDVIMPIVSAMLCHWFYHLIQPWISHEVQFTKHQLWSSHSRKLMRRNPIAFFVQSPLLLCVLEAEDSSGLQHSQLWLFDLVSPKMI